MEKPNLAGKWKKLKKDQILIGILAGILLLIIVFPEEKMTKTEQTVQTDQISVPSSEDTAACLEQRLQNILKQAEGVGEVKVMITLKNEGRKTVEKDHTVSENTDTTQGEEGRSTQSKTTEDSTIYERDKDGSEIPFVIEETAPRVEGVLVAAQGGDNLTVAENITEAAMVLFDVEAHKIKVMKLN